MTLCANKVKTVPDLGHTRVEEQISCIQVVAAFPPMPLRQVMTLNHLRLVDRGRLSGWAEEAGVRGHLDRGTSYSFLDSVLPSPLSQSSLPTCFYRPPTLSASSSSSFFFPFLFLLFSLPFLTLLYTFSSPLLPSLSQILPSSRPFPLSPTLPLSYFSPST